MDFILTRMLPLTTDMGTVLFSGNQMRRNIQLLAILATLPEVELTPDLRTNIQSLIPRLMAINDDRARFLHNPIGGGMGSPYYLIVHRGDGRGNTAMPVTAQMILERAEEAEKLWGELYIPPITYDLSKWGSAFPQYLVKDYPKAQQSKPQHQKVPKQNRRSKSEVDKTKPE